MLNDSEVKLGIKWKHRSFEAHREDKYAIVDSSLVAMATIVTVKTNRKVLEIAQFKVLKKQM